MTASGQPIKVLIVEDSPVCRDLLIHIFKADPDLQVIGTASNGEEALAALEYLKPDVISMDVLMPKMNGFEATRAIMSTQPVPIVIVTSSFSQDELSGTFQAFEAGALAVVNKPHGPGHPQHAAMVENLVRTLKAMSEVKLVRRWRPPRAPSAPVSRPLHLAPSAQRVRMIVIAASTGGPPALQAILAGLPKSFSAPLAIVQHISTGFVEGLRNWLQQTTGFPVHIANHREIPLPGHAYLAPDGAHLGFDASGRFLLSDVHESSLCPSASFLFRSAAAVFGDSAIGVILTGMGADGARELKLLKDRGAITFAQDKESSVVHGMPGEAIALGAAVHILPPDRIAVALAKLAGETS